jgi:tetratricopeptide (TPR) repeat protein
MLEASAARSEGDIERSITLLREAGAHMPGNDLVIASLGVDLSAAGRHEEAIQTLERALRGETDITGEAQVWTSLAWSYLRSGRAPKVSHVFDRAQESHAVSPELRVIRVLALAVVHGFVQRDRLVELVRLRASAVPMVWARSNGVPAATARRRSSGTCRGLRRTRTRRRTWEALAVRIERS